MKVSELLEKAQAYAQDCADAYTTTQHLRFNTHGCTVYPTKDSNFTVNMQGMPNEHALSQVIEKLDAPALAWIGNEKRCSLELRAKIFNNLAVDRPDAGLFIRHKGDNVRAVLSSQYTPLDNVMLIDLVGQAIGTMGVDVQVLRPTVGDHLSAYIVIPSVTFDNDPAYRGGDNGGLHPAVYISNSEIGTGSARTAGGLYRWYCSNGAIYGWKAEESLAVRHRWLSIGTMRAIVASGIASALKMSEKCAIAYVQAQEIHVEQVNLKSIINEWAGKYGLSVPAKESWLRAVTAETSVQERQDDPRLIDLFNGATYSAQSIENVPAREMVERMAGDMLYAWTNPEQVRRTRYGR
jgi:hypothetical protein